MKNSGSFIWNFLQTKLIWAVVIMIALGIAAGCIAPIWFVRIFTTFNSIFSAVLSFVVPLLILSFVTASIAETGSGAGKMLVWTVLLAYISTVLAGMFSFGVSDVLFPKLVTIHVGGTDGLEGLRPTSDFAPYFVFKFPPLMDTMSALLLSFCLGLSMLKFDMPVLKGMVMELKNVVMWMLTRFILPLLPVYIFGVFMKMTMAGEMKMITQVYLKVVAVMIVLFLVVLLLQYVIAGWVSKKNPFILFHKMFPAFLTALATSSSAATLPVTLRCAGKMGARDNVVNFVIPMCANIHLSGAAVRTVAIAIATMLIYQVPYTGIQFLGFIMIFSVTVLAAPGIPGSVIMAAVGLIETMLGFNQEMIALTVTLCIALDSIGTAVNVCGDGALMMIVDTICAPDSQKTEKSN